MMTDCEGKEINKGQKVVFTYGDEASVYVGTVIGFTPKNVKIEFKYKWSTTLDTTLKHPSYVYAI